MEYKLEALLKKTPAQREEYLNQAGNVAQDKLDKIIEVLAEAKPFSSLSVEAAIEDIALGGNNV